MSQESVETPREAYDLLNTGFATLRAGDLAACWTSLTPRSSSTAALAIDRLGLVVAGLSPVGRALRSTRQSGSHVVTPWPSFAQSRFLGLLEAESNVSDACLRRSRTTRTAVSNSKADRCIYSRVRAAQGR